MELLLESARRSGKSPPFWKNPQAWIKEQNLGRGYWTFFSAAFFFDAGFAVYFFLFNLYLLDRGFNERAMGLIGGAMTLGTLVGTLPAGMLSRKFGVRPLLIFLFLSAPTANALRAWWVWEPAQIGLAFLAGLFMSCWGVCFLPAVARLTTEQNRTSGFSLIFSVSVGTSMLGGIVCGYLRQWLAMAGIAMQPADVKRLILQASCAVAVVGLIPVLRLHLPPQVVDDANLENAPADKGWFQRWSLGPFLLRYLPLMALWSAVLAAFNPFANVYLSRNLHVPMASIGIVFSSVQIVQLCMGLLTPIVFRALGLINGIVATQVTAAIVLASMAGAANEKLAIALYLTFSAAQWMSSPGLYNLVMNETPDKDRSTAAAWTMFCNALAGTVATAASGIFITRYGYPPVFLALAAAAFIIALLFLLLISPKSRLTTQR